uniref:Uncharacterized protein n=1 Tax=Anguilla anguilla TaxID=7936 RepID=A0A0E9QCR6_ANGAN
MPSASSSVLLTLSVTTGAPSKTQKLQHKNILYKNTVARNVLFSHAQFITMFCLIKGKNHSLLGFF